MTAKRFTLKGLIEGAPNICDNDEIIEQEEAVMLLNELHEENKEFKALLDKMSDCNNEIWLDDGRIYRLRKAFKGEWVK